MFKRVIGWAFAIPVVILWWGGKVIAYIIDAVENVFYERF